MLTAGYRDSVLRNLPVLSSAAMKLVGTLAQPTVDIGEVEHVIQKDPLLCGELLRTVNSARYARQGRVNGIGQAVSLLGIGRVRRMALSLAVSSLFGRAKTAAHWSPLRFNLHSAAVALLADILAERLPVPCADAAFVAGLLHDVGKFAIAVNLPREGEKIWLMARDSGRSVAQCEREVLGFDHAAITGDLLKSWELPEAVYRAAGGHHDWEEELSRVRAFGSVTSVDLGLILNCADRFVNSLGMMTEAPLKELASKELAPVRLALPGFELDSDALAIHFAVEYEEFRELLL